MKQRPVIALLTDFGSSDSYVAAMKGVVLSICESAQVIDISHSIAAQNIDEAAYLLWSVYRFFPAGTIFVCVVDPGVGSSRGIVCVETKEYCFLTPDNGLLKYVISSGSPKSVRLVSNRKLFSNSVSNTFHGRDIFAPVAARLANGLSLSKLGPKYRLEYGVEKFITVDPGIRKTYSGRVIHIDHFGNIITNLMLSSSLKNPTLQLQIGKRSVRHFVKTYADADSGKPFMLIGSSGLLEISVRDGSAEHFLGAKQNQKVTLKTGENEI